MNPRVRPAQLPVDYAPFDPADVEGTVTRRFAAIVAAHGQRPAVDDGTHALTYADLDAASDTAAADIAARLGTEPEPVALLYRPGAPYNVAQLAVLKAGKFYASLDAELSAVRLARLLDDLETRLILCDRANAELARTLAGSRPGTAVVDTESSAESAIGSSKESSAQSPQGTGRVMPPRVELKPDSLAYIVYTSGSTGVPKGVMVSHRNVLHFTMNHVNGFRLGCEDRLSQLCPLNSAASGGETWPTLLAGAALFPYRLKAGGVGGSRALRRHLRAKRVTILTAVPVLFRLLARGLRAGDALPDLRLIRLSGDRILTSDAHLLRRGFSDRCLIRAALGAAECLLYTQFFVDAGYESDRQSLPAGYPLADMEVLIVDEALEPLAAGERGEIAVRSRYLADGYWRNPERTAERFRPDPRGEPGVRLYLTHDYGYLEEDGCLVHLGRTDFNVKIYGKMVSMTDVEETLLAVPGVTEAVVVARRMGRGGNVLTAFYKALRGAVLTEADLRARLRGRFPLEVVPKAFVRVEEMPVTKSNKIDRARLARGDWAPESGAPIPEAQG